VASLGPPLREQKRQKTGRPYAVIVSPSSGEGL